MSSISEDRDLKRLEIEIRNKLAQEHNWDKQEQHFLAIQEQFAKQRDHWLNQKAYWLVIVVLGVSVMILNLFGPTLKG